jgi:hypothetical protein
MAKVWDADRLSVLYEASFMFADTVRHCSSVLSLVPILY